MFVQFLRTRRLLISLCAPLLLAQWSYCQDEIEGVQPAALDQPRVRLDIRRQLKGDSLIPKSSEETNLEAFLDTGASSIVLSTETVEALGIRAQMTDGKKPVPVKFHDVGVGGSEEFSVTEEFFVSLIEYPNGGEELPPTRAVRGQIRPQGGVLQMLAPGMDIVGMPAMVKKVVVIDPTGLKNLDKLHTRVVNPGSRSIPKTKIHIPLTGVSFAEFTRVEPAKSPGPTIMANPMIGPDPFAKSDQGQPVVMVHKGRKAKGTFLLDTGAASSMISSRMAKELGIKVEEDGTPMVSEFQLPIGGIGGMKNARGIFFDRLELPTIEGKPLVYTKAPFLISDITMEDAQGHRFTQDGILGMNYLVSSAGIEGGMLPQLGEIVDGPFKMIVIDFDRGELGLEPR